MAESKENYYRDLGSEMVNNDFILMVTYVVIVTEK